MENQNWLKCQELPHLQQTVERMLEIKTSNEEASEKLRKYTWSAIVASKLMYRLGCWTFDELECVHLNVNQIRRVVQELSPKARFEFKENIGDSGVFAVLLYLNESDHVVIPIACRNFPISLSDECRVAIQTALDYLW